MPGGNLTLCCGHLQLTLRHLTTPSGSSTRTGYRQEHHDAPLGSRNFKKTWPSYEGIPNGPVVSKYEQGLALASVPVLDRTRRALDISNRPDPIVSVPHCSPRIDLSLFGFLDNWTGRANTAAGHGDTDVYPLEHARPCRERRV